MMKMFANAASALIFVGAMWGAAPMAFAQTAAAPAAASPVTLESDIKIERVTVDAAGKETVTLYAPSKVVVVPGDKVVFTLNVVNNSVDSAGGFRAVNPLPGPVQFVSVREDWAEVSVDGGNAWGKLASLKVKAKAAETGAETERAALPEDVTHVRWVFAQAIPAGGKSSLSYRGVVK